MSVKYSMSNFELAVQHSRMDQRCVSYPLIPRASLALKREHRVALHLTLLISYETHCSASAPVVSIIGLPAPNTTGAYPTFHKLSYPIFGPNSPSLPPTISLISHAGVIRLQRV
jgi:hypothetical protein